MARSALVALLAAWLCGCDGDLVNLGASSLSGGGGTSAGGAGAGPGTSRWLPPRLLFPQQEALNLSNPTLIEDESLLFYTEQLGSDDGRTAIYRRRAENGAWVERTEVDVGVAELDASSPAVSLDGSQLWFGQNVPEGAGGTDIWVSERSGEAWAQPVLAPLNTPFDDSPRPIGGGGLLMPLSSRRHDSERFQIYLASRTSPTASWQSIDQALLGAVNSSSDSFASSGGFITRDGLTLYFSSTRSSATGSDLFVARRSSLEEPFGEAAALQGVNTAANETTPWVSPLGERLYFASDRPTAEHEGQYALYLSERAP